MKSEVFKVTSCSSCPNCNFENHGAGIKGNCIVVDEPNEIDVVIDKEDNISIPIAPEWCPLRGLKGYKITYRFDIQ